MTGVCPCAGKAKVYSEADVQEACAKARKAQTSWIKTSYVERGKIILISQVVMWLHIRPVGFFCPKKLTVGVYVQALVLQTVEDKFLLLTVEQHVLNLYYF